MVNNFKYLDDLIHSGAKKVVLDSDIILDSNEKSTYSEGIEIDVKDLIIDGNGHTIDARNKTRIFRITGNGTIIRNIKFKNGSMHRLSVNNAMEGKPKPCDESTFSFFEKNYGGAIFIKSFRCTIVSCDFVNCVSYNGGAVYSDSKCTIVSCNFVNCSANYGGAICNKSDLKLNKSTFKHNTAKKYIVWGEGGAVYNYGTCDCNECEFIENSSRNGGAIFNESSVFTLNKCNFTGNHANGKGGAIGNNKSSEVIPILDSGYGVKGTENYADTYFYCEDSNFSDNSSKKVGGAVWTNDNCDFLNCSFMDNHSKNGNVFYYTGIEDMSLIVEKSVISNNASKKPDIYINSGFSRLKNVKFDKVYKNYCIHNKNGVLDILNPKFANDDGHIILNENILWTFKEDGIHKLIESTNKSVIKYKDDYLANVKGFEYLDNLINGGDEEIHLDFDIVLQDFEQSFYEGGIELNKDNLIVDGNNHMVDGNNFSRIFHITGKNITLKNIKFVNGKYFRGIYDRNRSGGGAINILHEASLNLENCDFMNNVSRTVAGCINNNGVLNVHETKFKGNNAQFGSGSISNFNDVHLKSCLFEDNFALNPETENECYQNTGGNIFNEGDIELDACSFKNSKEYDRIIKVNKIYNILTNVMIKSLYAVFIVGIICGAIKLFKILNDFWFTVFVLYFAGFFELLLISSLIIRFLLRRIFEGHIRNKGFDYLKSVRTNKEILRLILGFLFAYALGTLIKMLIY